MNDDDNLAVDYYCDYGHELAEDTPAEEGVDSSNWILHGFECPVPNCQGWVKLARDQHNEFTGDEVCEYGHILESLVTVTG